jgi:ABC-2 type transport system permease protein
MVIFRHQTRLLLGDPGPVVVFLVIPLLVMAIIKNTQKAALLAAGYHNVTGAEQAVPGLTAMFAFFWLAFIGRTFFAEHGWGTWERLQAMGTPAEVMIGKLLPAFVIITGQMILLFVVGDLVLGMKSKGSLAALVIVGPALALCVLALTFALVAFCRTLSQLDALSNLLMMVFAALGGALALHVSLPGWAQSIAPAIPSYWAIKAATSVILDGKGFGAVIVPTLVLLAFTAGFSILAAVRFRATDVKAVA